MRLRWIQPLSRKTVWKIYDIIVHRRWWVIAACVRGALAAGSGMRFIEFSNNYRVFFSPENPQLQAFEQLQNVYTKSDNALFVVAPKDGKVFTRQTLATVQWLTQQAWKLPYSSRVDSVTNFQHTTARGDDLVVRDLVPDPAALSDADLARIREIALHEPLLLNRLIPPAGHVTGVNVTMVMPEKSLDEVPEVAARARALAEAARARGPRGEVYFTRGGVMENRIAR